MYVGINHYDGLFQSLKYNYSSYSTTFRHIYYKMVPKGDSYVTKIVIIADLDKSHIYTEEGVESMKQAIACQYESVEPSDVFVIGIGSNKAKGLKNKNLILKDFISSGILYKNYDSLYEEEAEAVLEHAKDIKREELHRRAAFGPLYGVYGTTIAYLFTAAIFISHLLWTQENHVLYGLSAVDVFKNGDSYRLFTYMFTHGNLYHMVSNCISMMILGSSYAKRRNSLDFSIVFIGSGILSGIMTILSSMLITNNPEKVTVGASGAIFALLGALVMSIMLDPSTKGRRSSYIKYAAFVIIINLFGTNVDHVCHMTGFLSGMFLEFVLNYSDNIYYLRKYVETRDRKKVH